MTSRAGRLVIDLKGDYRCGYTRSGRGVGRPLTRAFRGGIRSHGRSRRIDAMAERAPVISAARLVVVDDEEVTRLGLRSILSDESDVQVVAEGATGRDAVALCDRLEPDLLVTDIDLRELDGLAAARQIREIHPRTKVLIVTTHEAPEYILEALRAGATGYVLKSSSRLQILTAVREVLRGQIPARSWLSAQPGDHSPPHDASPELTTREREVLDLVVAGATNTEISRKLNISLSTVKGHVERILAKLGVTNRTHAAVKAIRLGLTRPPSEPHQS